MNQEQITLVLILILPVFGGIASYLVRSDEQVHWISTAGIFLALILSFLQLIKVDASIMIWRFEWWQGFAMGWRIDRMSAALITLVCGITFLVHLFSGYYMKDDADKRRYYFYMGIFTTSMLGLLAADHLLMLFIFWEMVGFTSYLLIGFWYRDANVPGSAKMAFMTNRIADVFLLGALILWITETGSGFISDMTLFEPDEKLVVWISLGFLIGAMGKSAQFPFFSWLPRAMVGPTTVSALIHAATMVTAGVYLLIRINIIFPEDVLMITAIIGMLTAFIGSVAALTQWDIKAVLAYSTVSQLGYMVMAVGAGASDMAFFHLWTHAFFKAGLFLSAGAILHALHVQDMRRMGGMRLKMPFTFYVYLLCMLSLSGLPFFSGFLSKEGIILKTWLWAFSLEHTGFLIVPVIAMLVVVLTATYMMRQLVLVFLKEHRFDASKASFAEPLYTLKIPLGILALGSLWIVYDINPFAHQYALMNWVMINELLPSNIVLTLVSVVLVAAGLIYAFLRFRDFAISGEKYKNPLSLVSFHAFYVDRFYSTWIGKGFVGFAIRTNRLDTKFIDPLINFAGMFTVVVAKASNLMDRYIIDGLVILSTMLSRRIGWFTRALHSRQVQFQFVVAILGLILLISWFNIL